MGGGGTPVPATVRHAPPDSAKEAHHPGRMVSESLVHSKNRQFVWKEREELGHAEWSTGSAHHMPSPSAAGGGTGGGADPAGFVLRGSRVQERGPCSQAHPPPLSKSTVFRDPKLHLDLQKDLKLVSQETVLPPPGTQVPILDAGSGITVLFAIFSVMLWINSC